MMTSLVSLSLMFLCLGVTSGQVFRFGSCPDVPVQADFDVDRVSDLTFFGYSYLIYCMVYYKYLSILKNKQNSNTEWLVFNYVLLGLFLNTLEINRNYFKILPRLTSAEFEILCCSVIFSISFAKILVRLKVRKNIITNIIKQ